MTFRFDSILATLSISLFGRWHNAAEFTQLCKLTGREFELDLAVSDGLNGLETLTFRGVLLERAIKMPGGAVVDSPRFAWA